MPEIWISEEVENYFAASPIGPLLELCEVAQDDDHPISHSLKEALARIPDDVVAADNIIEWLYYRTVRLSRIWVMNLILLEV
jgi:hypothetical protein